MQTCYLNFGTQRCHYASWHVHLKEMAERCDKSPFKSRSQVRWLGQYSQTKKMGWNVKHLTRSQTWQQIVNHELGRLLSGLNFNWMTYQKYKQVVRVISFPNKVFKLHLEVEHKKILAMGTFKIQTVSFAREHWEKIT